MSSQSTIRPTSLDGIKRLATSIKRERKIPHSSALDQASISAGFENYRHARNSLLTESSAMGVAIPLNRIYITAYWRDRVHKSGGRETLNISLPFSLRELVEPRHLLLHRAFVRFRMEAQDHLESIQLSDSQSGARRSICAAARALQFMQATRLVPSKSHSRAYPNGDSNNSVPGSDHYSVWYQRETKQFIFVDEPYGESARRRHGKRAEWARQFGQTIIKPSWAGMYYPDGGSELYLIADSAKGADVRALGAALDQLPPPVVESDWNGESAPEMPRFASPSAHMIVKRAKPKTTRTAKGNLNTVGYVQTFVGPQRKPSARMPVPSHARVGELIKTVMAVSFNRKGVYSKLNSVRCELDEWAQQEHVDLPSDQFFNLYYREKAASFSRTIGMDEGLRLIANLSEVKRILHANYPESKPLRSVISKVDLALKSMLAWIG